MSINETIHVDRDDYDRQNWQEILDWVRAHDVNPDSVPCPGDIVLHDGKVTFEQYVFDADAKIVLELGEPIKRHFTTTQRAPWPVPVPPIQLNTMGRA